MPHSPVGCDIGNWPVATVGGVKLAPDLVKPHRLDEARRADS